ncbi:nitroreductase family protein [Desulfovibrio sp. OttesenSCG-928-A18]|nr:nitroreductase family protein [Desulfovibrio sp. OttesenSCG-928-A18]
MPRFSVVPELCRQDGICASVCPAHVIKGPKGMTPVMKPGREDSCIACGQCMAFCPHGAARVDVLPLEDMQPIDRKTLPDASSLDQLFRSRRSTRHYKNEPVPKELLEQLLAATRHAPSAKNRRALRWVLVYEPDMMRAIGDAVCDWLGEMLADAAKAPLLGEAKALVRAWRSGLDPFFRGAPHLALAVTPKGAHWAEADAAIALTYLELAALPHKVGCCWAGYVSTAARMHQPLQSLLGLTENELVSGGQMLGFIALRPTSSAPRRPFPVHWL